MLRVGVIGCGGMGKDHIKRLTNKIQGAEVVAVSDVFEESAKQAAAICGAKVYTDANELINDPDVDAVFIVSPGFAHVWQPSRQEREFSVRNRSAQLLRTA